MNNISDKISKFLSIISMQKKTTTELKYEVMVTIVVTMHMVAMVLIVALVTMDIPMFVLTLAIFKVT